MMQLLPQTPATDGDAPADDEPACTRGPAALPRPNRTRLAYLMMLGSSLTFAAMSACSHAAGQRCDWRFPALTRAALVFLISLLIARARGTPLVWLRPPTLWIRSIAGSISMLMTFYALTHLNVSTTVTLTNTFPLWVIILAWPVLRQRPTLGVALALLSGIAGVVLIERPDQGNFRLASLGALLAAFCTAVVMLGLHRLKTLDPVAIVVHFSAVATVFIGGFTLWTATHGHPLDFAQLADPTTLALLLGIAVTATAGQILMTAAFRIALPQRLSVVGLTQVIFALGFDLLLWPRPLDLAQLLGIALVIAPVAWLLGRGKK